VLESTCKQARAWLVSVAVLAVLVLPGRSSAAVLYDQTGTANAGCISSSDFGIANKVAQGADDFTVPTGASWQITKVDTIGGGALTGSPTAAVFLYGPGPVPGAQIFGESGIPVSGANNISILVTGAPPLSAGTYWLSVQITDPVQWTWCAEQAQFGAAAAWRNPGDGFSTGCTAYTPVTSCFVTFAKSFLFRLNTPDPLPAAPPASTPRRKKCKKKHRRSASTAKKRKCKKRKRR